MDIAEWERAYEKLIKLTKSGELKWIQSPSYVGDTDCYLCQYLDFQIRLRVGEGYNPLDTFIVEFVDVYGKAVWLWPESHLAEQLSSLVLEKVAAQPEFAARFLDTFLP